MDRRMVDAWLDGQWVDRQMRLREERDLSVLIFSLFLLDSVLGGGTLWLQAGHFVPYTTLSPPTPVSPAFC